ncbi:hypothetical protein CEXT_558791 [Caerostris extrusa]|uniref:Uncharacterized protein n=1 Tax=Caerostris extrusa TaxID=172846 RepID=A0AAV4RRQ8_CAEEX|nr:hypothetical protein CEXT_558791 [Caerostris extrusa]
MLAEKRLLYSQVCCISHISQSFHSPTAYFKNYCARLLDKKVACEIIQLHTSLETNQTEPTRVDSSLGKIWQANVATPQVIIAVKRSPLVNQKSVASGRLDISPAVLLDWRDSGHQIKQVATGRDLV